MGKYKELSKRLDKIEKHLQLNTEITVSCEYPKNNEVTFWGGNPNSKNTEIKNEKPLSIREVQVKLTSQEEANECAEIARACG